MPDYIGNPANGESSSYAFSAPNGGVPKLQLPGIGSIKGGIVGGGTVRPGGTQAIGVKETPGSHTLALLGRVGDQFLADYLKEKKTEAFVSGMQRAMQGEAVSDIADSQPWYTRIFGQSDAVEGARAYTGNTVAQTQVAAMQEAMPTLRTMDGPSAQKFFVEKIKGAMTGDAATDLSIQTSLVNALPAVMRQQAKEHYGWQQEQATAAEDTSFTSQAKSLQGLGESYSKGYVTPEEFKAQKLAFVRAQVPVVGRDEKNWQEAQKDRLIRAARQGQFHVLEAAQMPADGDKGPSLLEALPIDKQTQVLAAIDAGQRSARNIYLPQVAEQIADIRLRAEHPPEGTTPQELYDRAVKMNSEYTAKTGNPMGPWSADELIALKKGAGSAIWTLRDQNARAAISASTKAATEAEKAKAEQEQTNHILTAAGTGALYQIAATPGYSADKTNYVVQNLYRSLTPENQNKLLVANAQTGYVIKPVSQEKEAAINAALASTINGKAGFGDGMMKAYASWKELHDKDANTASAYYPTHGPKLEHFQRLLDGGFSPQEAFGPAFVNPIPKPAVDKKIRDAAVAEIASKENGWFVRDLPASTINFLSSKIEDSTAEYAGVLADPKMAATRAYNVLKASGKVELVGGYAWDAQPDPTQRLVPWLTKKYGDKVLKAGGQTAMPYDSVNSTFKAAMDEFINGGVVPREGGGSMWAPGIAHGKKVVNTVIHVIPRGAKESPDTPPRLAVSVMDDEGQQYDAVITGNDIFDMAARRKKLETQGTSGANGEYGLLGIHVY